MTERRRAQPYEFVLRGEISDRFELVFDGMQLERGNGQTVLSGSVVDQSHLHAVIEQIGDLGFELVSVSPRLDHHHGKEPQ